MAEETLPDVTKTVSTHLITPTQDYRKTDHQAPVKTAGGNGHTFAHSIVGIYRKRKSILQKMMREAELIDSMAPRYKDVDDATLKSRLDEFRLTFRRKPDHESLPLYEAPGCRARGCSPANPDCIPIMYSLVGVLALHRGFLAEMATGEGKTLTAGVAAVLAVVDGQAVSHHYRQRLSCTARRRMASAALFLLRAESRFRHRRHAATRATCRL